MRTAVGIFLIVAVLFVGSETAVSHGNFADPAHPGKCVVEGLVLSPGQTARHPKNCQRIICGQDGATTFHSCGVYGLPANKKFGKYKAPNANYPACCEREIIDA
ncbi:hypothetical protein KR018_004400 [Drosophila ironensis]|nr:hypothetical protein KR018_004400 [Drosophila ironensis]